MKPSKNNDADVIKVLKQQMKVESGYNEKFVAARKIQQQRDIERESEFEKFKRNQKKQYDSDEMLRDYLTKIKE